MIEEKEQAEKVVDVVYIMDNKSKQYNLELLFSLRSIKKHLKNYNKIHIFGADMTGVIKRTSNVKHHHVDIDYSYGVNSQIKKYKIIEIVCKEESVSDDFLLVSDDCFLLKDQDAKNFPYYYSGNLSERIEGFRWQLSASVRGMTDTLQLLKTNNRKQRYFNTHAPITINKKKFLSLRDIFYIEEFEDGLVYKTLYCNYFKVKGEYTLMKLIYKASTRRKELETKLINAPFFSVNNNSITQVVIKKLATLFPNMLSWEK
jgi:hypothetical protein